MREMRRKDKEVTDRQWMENILKRAVFMHMGMVDADGSPYVVPVGYGYKNGALYMHGAPEGRKNDILAANPRVCFQVALDAEVKTGAAPSDYTMKYRSVTGYGVVRPLTDPAERNEALNAVMDQIGGPHADYPEDSPMHKKLWIARLEVESMTGKKSVYED